MPLPEFLSSRGYAVVADTVHRSTFALCSEADDVARMELELPVTVNLFYGPSPHEALGRSTLHTGRPRVPPAFAFAPWNDAIFGSTNVLAIASALRAAGAPSSVIWTEDWRGGTWNGDDYQLDPEWDVDTTLYPGFSQIASQLHAEGFKWLVYFNAFVEQNSAAWAETEPNGYLIKNAEGGTYTFLDAFQNPTSLVDLTNPAAAAWATGKMSAALALGADGWMGDYGEWLPTDAVLSGGSGLDLHASYSLLWQEAQRAALDPAIAADGVQRLMFVRSGGFGTAALADVFWAGDQRTDFEVDDGMPTVVPIGVGVGLSGVSTFGSDIAGYQSATNPTSTKELFFRWTELGAWSPVMRTHHGTEPKLEWNWQSDADTTAEWVTYAKLHMALAPTMRGLAQVAADTGVSIWRPLAVEFPADGASWPVADEVMVGSGLLVAPVQTMGETSRSVYLPSGTWFPWSGGASTAGGTTITAAAAVTDIPVYALAGTVVPTFPDGVETLTEEPSSAPGAASVGDDRVVYAFSGAAGSFTEAPDASASGTLTYTLATSASTGTVTWNGAPLTACGATPAAPCSAAVPGQVTAHVTGNGALIVPGATLRVVGGSAGRQLTLVIRS
jgi:alpha-glucosidase